MKVFQKSLMASEDVKSYLGTGVSDTIAFNDGDAVIVGGLVSNDINKRALTYGAAANAVVDYVGVSQGDIQGVTYRVGTKIAGLSAQKSEPVRYRILIDGDTFYLATGNFGAAPAVGKFATASTDGTWAVVDVKPASGLYISIDSSKNLVMGSRNADMIYFCTAHKA